jgi:hypothetical protein
MKPVFTVIIILITSLNLFNLPSVAQEENTEKKETEKPGPPAKPPAFTIDYNYILLNLLIDKIQPPPNVDISKLPPQPKYIYSQSHLLDLTYRYNITEAISIKGLLPLKLMTMDLYPENGKPFNFTSYGLRDPAITANYTLFLNQANMIEFSAGVSFPLGSINQRGRSPFKENDYLPFPMQLGSGTFDILPGIFYRGLYDRFSWAVSAKSTIRTGRNSLNYKFGNMYSSSVMLRYDWLKWFAQSVRLDALYIDKYEGNTKELTPGFLPDPSTQTAFNLDLVLNFSIFNISEFLKNSRLDLDFSIPVAQVVNNFPKKIYGIRLGLQKGF